MANIAIQRYNSSGGWDAIFIKNKIERITDSNIASTYNYKPSSQDGTKRAALTSVINWIDNGIAQDVSDLSPVIATLESKRHTYAASLSDTTAGNAAFKTLIVDNNNPSSFSINASLSFRDLSGATVKISDMNIGDAIFFSYTSEVQDYWLGSILNGVATFKEIGLDGAAAAATSTIIGGVKVRATNTINDEDKNQPLYTTTSNRWYRLELDSNKQGFVCVPWEDTTYSGSRGVIVDNGVLRHTNSTTARTTKKLRTVKVDDYGHITVSNDVNYNATTMQKGVADPSKSWTNEGGLVASNDFKTWLTNNNYKSQGVIGNAQLSITRNGANANFYSSDGTYIPYTMLSSWGANSNVEEGTVNIVAGTKITNGVPTSGMVPGDIAFINI